MCSTQTVNLCKTACRNHGPRDDRQKARMIWMVEALGEEKWKELIEQYMGGVKLRPAVKVRRRGMKLRPAVKVKCEGVKLCPAVNVMCACEALPCY